MAKFTQSDGGIPQVYAYLWMIFFSARESEKDSCFHPNATSCHRAKIGTKQRSADYLCIKKSITDMEVVIIEKRTFEALLTSVATLTEKVNALHHRCNDKKMSRWLDGQDVCRLLHISQRTLQTLRDNRLIGFSQINRKFYYKPDEVERLLPVIDMFRTERDTP
ncbi:hypothetical protein BN938_0604 [Mucinivorans hirudinis]|uniref:Helix-turn-helix domain-containing protein n=1 Tax=Mucinivorans hirudinis TaxID=1433126 RepID=A0A060RBD4_9BACT|nr:hypothetical protein BN938_0604 [Mucinivorans hirudinis]